MDARRTASGYGLLSMLCLMMIARQPVWGQEGAVGALSRGVVSPTAASLGKYGDLPVSLYTGTPAVNIPLLTLEGRDLRVPVVLAYHASGLKVAEIPGWVGQGWSLQAGGVITRTVRGMPDDAENGYAFTHGALEAALQEEDLYPYLQDVETARVDPEPDQFFFNFAGYAGQFVMGDGNDPDQIRTTPYRKFKFEMSRALRNVPGAQQQVEGVTRWTITTEDGIRYHFGERSGSVDGEGLAWTYDTGQAMCTECAHVSSWYLVRIESPTGEDVVTFDYERSATAVMHRQQTYREEVVFFNANQCTGPTLLVQENTSKISALWLSSITAGGGSLVFQTSLRDDAVHGQTGLPQEMRLDGIERRTPGGVVAQVIRFTYAYTGTDADARRLYLQAVHTEDAGGHALPPHRFSYNPTLLPARSSSAVDHWGYYNGAQANTDLIPPLLYTHPISGEDLFFEGADREPSVVPMQAGMLEKITYPTGGTTTFTYEPHAYGYVNEDLVSQGLGDAQEAVATRFGGDDLPLERTQVFTVQAMNEPVLPVSVSVTLWLPEGLDNNVCPNGGTCVYVKILDEAGQQVYANTEVSNTPLVLIPDTMAARRYRVLPTDSTHTQEHLLYAHGETTNETVLLPSGTYTLVAGTHAFCYEEELDECLAQIRVGWRDIVAAGERMAGGLRIRRMEHDDGFPDTPNVVSDYVYEEGGRSSGVLVQEPRYHYEDLTGYCAYLSRSARSVVGLGMTQGSPVGYKRVTVYQGGAAEPSGRTEHVFQAADLDADRVDDEASWPFAARTSFDYVRGYERERHTFNQAGQPVMSLHQERYDTYADDVVPDPSVTHVYQALTVKQGLGEAGAIYAWPYDVVAAWLHPVSETTTTYDASGVDPVTLTRSVAFADRTHLQPTGRVEYNTDGAQRLTEYVYAHQHQQALGNDGMIQHNLLLPVYAETVKDEAARTQAKAWTVWGETDGFWRPRAGWGWVGSGDGDTTAPEDPGGAETLQASAWLQYDAYGNILAQQDAWGHETTFAYDAAGLHLVSLIRGQIENRYTYYPSGEKEGLLKAITDENEQSTTFDYDAFGRLTEARNAAGEVTATYAYHFTADTPATDPSYVQVSKPLQGTAAVRATEYLDGLGRSVQHQVQDGTEAVVTATEYDALGRISKAWKPYLYHTGDAFDPAYRSHAQDYYDGAPGPSSGARPYLESRYLTDPLARIRAVLAEGNDDEGRSVRTEYGTARLGAYPYTHHTILNEEGHRTRTYFDAFGNRVRVETGDGAIETLFVYDVRGQLVQGTDPQGLLTHYRYDPLGRLTAKTTPDADGDGDGEAGNETAIGADVDYRYAYDPAGNLRFSVDPNEAAGGLVRFHTYDEHARPVLIGQAAATIAQFDPLAPYGTYAFEQADGHAAWLAVHAYDDVPDTTAFPWNRFSWNGLTVTNARGRLAATAFRFTDQALPATLVLDELIIMNDGETHRFEAREHLEARHVSFTGTTEAVFNSGEEIRLTPGFVAGAGALFHAAIDTTLLGGDGAQDEAGWGRKVYGYDAEGRVQDLVVDLGPDFESRRVHYAYDRQGNVVKVSYQEGAPDAFFTWYEYDEAGRLHLIKTNTADNTSAAVTEAVYTYTPEGQVDRLQLGAVQTVDYRYGIRGWLTHINDPAQPGTDAFALRLAYDDVTETPPGVVARHDGNIAWMAWQTSGNSFPAARVGYAFSYDALSRLTEADFYRDEGSWSEAAAYDVGTDTPLQYDGNGNLMHLTRKDENGQETAAAYHYGDGNRLTSVTGGENATFAYDGNGNMIEGPGMSRVSYDHRNLPALIETGALSLSFQYDAAGRRVSKEANNGSGFYYVRGVDGTVLAVYDEAGTLQHWNLLAAGQPFGRLDAGVTPGRYYYLRDHLGSTRATVNTTGAVVHYDDYYPFGLQMPGRSSTTSMPPQERYTGHTLDEETGLYYAGARYYLPALGRWMSVDPILSRLSPKALLETDMRLLSMSPYNYVFNNPTNLTDPDGECPVCLAVWGVVEVGIFAYDVYDAYKTSTNPNASGLDKGISVGGLAASFFLPGGGYSSLDNLLGTAAKSFSKYNIDKAAVNIVKGSSDKAAVVIGQGMDRVEGLADEIGAMTFKPTQQAIQEWNDLLEQAGGKHLSDEVVMKTSLFMENQRWINKAKEEGRTILDIGSQSGKGNSTFYEMEKKAIYEGN